MKAMIIENFGGPEQLRLEEIEKPIPGNGEILIRIFYTAVNPVDWKIREGLLKDRLPHHFPMILGWDAAGKIEEVGNEVTHFQVGDEVYAYCRKPDIQWGTYAEYIALNAKNVALKPKNITFAQAAALPLVALTAWQALFDVGGLKKGEKILIHAGAGGVGSLAIQFAKNVGAKVYTTASQINHEYVKQLGADVPIDYKKDNFASHIKMNEPKGVDMVFDTVGKETLEQSIPLIKEGGRLVSIVQNSCPKLCNERQIQFSYVFVRPNGEQLKEISHLIEEGKVIVPQTEEMQLSEAAIAQEINKKGHTRGKIILKVP